MFTQNFIEGMQTTESSVEHYYFEYGRVHIDSWSWKRFSDYIRKIDRFADIEPQDIEVWFLQKPIKAIGLRMLEDGSTVLIAVNPNSTIFIVVPDIVNSVSEFVEYLKSTETFDVFVKEG